MNKMGLEVNGLVKIIYLYLALLSDKGKQVNYKPLWLLLIWRKHLIEWTGFTFVQTAFLRYCWKTV